MQCDVIHNFLNTMDALNQEGKRPKDYGTGDVLYYAETRMLDAIYRSPRISAVQMSRQMGITRGAVTQMSNRLEEKGYIERYLQEGNNKVKYFRLTGLGQAVKAGHDDYHKAANRKICDYIKSLGSQEVDIIIDFLKVIKDLPVCEFECSEHCRTKKE